MAPRRFGFLPQRRPAGRGGLARRGATSPCAAGWLLFLANIRSAQSYALLIGLCPRGRMFIFVDDRTRRRLGRFSVSPRRRPSLRPPKPAWAFSGSPHGARVCGGFDCFLGRLFWRCSFSPLGRASGFFFAWLRPSFCSFRAAAFTLLFFGGGSGLLLQDRTARPIGGERKAGPNPALRLISYFKRLLVSSFFFAFRLSRLRRVRRDILSRLRNIENIILFIANGK